MTLSGTGIDGMTAPFLSPDMSARERISAKSIGFLTSVDYVADLTSTGLKSLSYSWRFPSTVVPVEITARSLVGSIHLNSFNLTFDQTSFNNSPSGSGVTFLPNFPLARASATFSGTYAFTTPSDSVSGNFMKTLEGDMQPHAGFIDLRDYPRSAEIQTPPDFVFAGLTDSQVISEIVDGSLLEFDLGTISLDFDQNTTAVLVPEPSSSLLLGGAVAFLALRRKRWDSTRPMRLRIRKVATTRPERRFCVRPL